MGAGNEGARLVLHVLPQDMPRGAQRYARSLRDSLDGRPDDHRILTLYRGDAGVLEADYSLERPAVVRPRLGVDLLLASALRARLKELAPAVVVAHGGEPLKYVVATRYRVPLAYYRIGIAPLDSWAGPRGALQRHVISRADVVVGVSRAAAADVSAHVALEPSRLRVIPNGRDPELFSPRDPTDSHGPPTIVFVGHLTRTKRPDLFLDLVSALRTRGIGVAAKIAGTGPLLEDIQRRGAALGVDVLGPRDDVPDILRAADVFVFTSIAEGEGMPGVLIEAGLSGLPVVTTDVPGARDVVVDGETGFVRDPEDLGGLVSAVASLCQDAALRQRMGASARERCVTEFTLRSSVNAWNDLITELAISSEG